MVYTLAASLHFVLVSQFVGEHHGCSKKERARSQSLPGGWRVAERHSRSFSYQREERVETGEQKKEEIEKVTGIDKREGWCGITKTGKKKKLKRREKVETHTHFCMLILVSYGTRASVRKGCSLGSSGDWTCLPSKQSTDTSRHAQVHECPGFAATLIAVQNKEIKFFF